ncbi:MAG: hypothetical protein LQ351_004045 [Letrouitia transgressa]|nr:MAG: hypothetical protein LQ351_004045 [Letrouitia transgressa]
MAFEIPDLEVVAGRISKNASFLQSFLIARELPRPSFNVDAPKEFPNPENERSVEVIREKVIEDTRLLFDLILGPTDRLKWGLWQMMDVATLQVIYHFKLGQAVPLDGGATFAEIAENVGLTEHRVASVLRHAAMNKIFYEDKPNHVVHTAMSKTIISDPLMWDYVGHYTEENFPSTAKWSETLERFPKSEELNECPFSVALDYYKPGGFFQYTKENPESQRRFFNVMRAVGLAPGVDYRHVAKGYDWEGLGNATVIDVGGSAGHLSMALAKKFPKLKFIIQDMKETVEENRRNLPAEFQDRISYEIHDFFTPQPIKADIYLMRHIVHSWPDKWVIKLLKETAVAMEPNSKIIIVETIVLPGGQYDYLEERWARKMDLLMFTVLNAQDRSADEWASIVKKADPRLSLGRIEKPAGSHDAIIEIIFGYPN